MLYRERLTVPVAYWVVLALFALSLLAAFGAYLGPVWGIGVGVATLLVGGAVFWSAGIVITVTDERVNVGRATIEARYLQEALGLTNQEAARRRGPDADARAYLVLRPYIAGAIELVLDDVDDPVPYWLVATRHPVKFGLAVNRLMSGTVPSKGDVGTAGG